MKSKPKVPIGETVCNVDCGETGLACYAVAHFPSELKWNIICEHQNTDNIVEVCEYNGECDFQRIVDDYDVKEYPELFEDIDEDEIKDDEEHSEEGRLSIEEFHKLYNELTKYNYVPDMYINISSVGYEILYKDLIITVLRKLFGFKFKYSYNERKTAILILKRDNKNQQ